KIDLKDVFTFFEVQDAEVEKAFQGFKAVDFNGRQVRVEVSGEDARSSSRNGNGRARSYRNDDRYSEGHGERRSGNDRGRSYNKDFRDFSGKRRESKSRY